MSQLLLISAALDLYDGSCENLSQWLRETESQFRDCELKSTLKDKENQVQTFKVKLTLYTPENNCKYDFVKIVLWFGY